MDCNFQCLNIGCSCSQCGYSLTRKYEEAPHRNCDRPRMEVGDALAAVLESVGITPESWIEFKKKFGGAPSCNCGPKKEWLNHISKEFGIGDKISKLKSYFNF